VTVDGARPATIYDVARAAGVSHQTVSRYLKGFAGITPGTRSKVEAALDALNYRPNLTARSLATRRSHRIGALVYEMEEVGPSRTVQAASSAARDAGYLLDIVSLDPLDDGVIESALRLMGEHQFAGIIASAPTDRLRAALADTDFRVPVFIDEEIGERPDGAPSAVLTGARLTIDHLADLGHERILHLAGPRDWVIARERAAAYRTAMTERGLRPLGLAEASGWSPGAGYRTARVADLGRVTAIYAANDQLALGALRALHERGITVPGDMSIVGTDDIPEAEFFIPSLTTVREDFAAHGRYAIDSLLAMIEGRDRPARSDYETVEFMTRASTAMPPEASARHR
jgi:DNA-binding LacI/PurR family transcriptional regulator